MTETLRTVSEEAAKNYDHHRENVSELEFVEKKLPVMIAGQIEDRQHNIGMLQAEIDGPTDAPLAMINVDDGSIVEQSSIKRRDVERLEAEVTEIQKNKDAIPQMVEGHKRALEQQVVRSGEHFVENEAAYKDLAAIDAYMDGVKLNVDHPLHNQK